MYWIDTDLETCLQRHKGHKAVQRPWVSRKRKKADAREPITEALLREWHSKAQLPVEEEGFDRVFYVMGISPTEFDIREQKPKEK